MACARWCNFSRTSRSPHKNHLHLLVPKGEFRGLPFWKVIA